MTHEMQWGARFGGEVDECRSRDDALSHIARVDEGGEIVLRMLSPWMRETVAEEMANVKLPVTECSNCKSTNLAFDCGITESRPGPFSAHPQFYQGCNDCSETLWIGDWDTFCAVLALLYDIRIPRID